MVFRTFIYTYDCYVMSGKYEYCQGDVREMSGNFNDACCYEPCVYSDADQRKHQSSASLAFVRGNHRGPVNSPHKWPVKRKMFPFDDVIMWCPFLGHVFGAEWRAGSGYTLPRLETSGIFWGWGVYTGQSTTVPTAVWSREPQYHGTLKIRILSGAYDNMYTDVFSLMIGRTDIEM